MYIWTENLKYHRDLEIYAGHINIDFIDFISINSQFILNSNNIL